mmetsp:Transcript_96676/g.167792  ORF Transcript_96676/g.167792 Transcript_96676/m.167792 type:complete len:143 (-) Transcript_96676:19-447(-)
MGAAQVDCCVSRRDEQSEKASPLSTARDTFRGSAAVHEALKSPREVQGYDTSTSADMDLGSCCFTRKQDGSFKCLESTEPQEDENAKPIEDSEEEYVEQARSPNPEPEPEEPSEIRTPEKEIPVARKASIVGSHDILDLTLY